MALKDWKKIGKDQWNNYSKKHNLAIEPDRDNDFVVMVENYSLYLPVIVRRFRTKSQALKFAKSYMRKH